MNKNGQNLEALNEEEKKKSSPFFKLLIFLLIGVAAFIGAKRYRETYLEFDNAQEDQDIENYIQGIEVSAPVQENPNDPFYGWKLSKYQDLYIKFPPTYEMVEGSSMNTIACTNGLDKVIQVDSAKKPSPKFTICYLRNNQNLSLLEYMRSDNSWLKGTSAEVDLSFSKSISKNWNTADISLNYEGFRITDLSLDGKNTEAIFIRRKGLPDIYVFEIDKVPFKNNPDEYANALYDFLYIVKSIQ